MKPRKLRELITEELALTWLQVQGHAFTPAAFAREHGVVAVGVGRALLRLQGAGVVALSRPAGASAQVVTALTPLGQRVWVSQCAASRLPGSRAQMQQLYEFLPGAQAVSAPLLEQHLGLPAMRVRQLLLMLASLGSVELSVDDEGGVTAVQVHPRLLRHLVEDLEAELEGRTDLE